MLIGRTRRGSASWRSVALQVATCIGLMCVCGAAQSASDDPCRFFTADAMGKAFGRPMKSSKLANVCDYRGPGTDRVVVKVSAGPEGTIMRHAKATSAQGDKTVEKVAIPVGEAYFDSTLPVFVGRVGNHEVQIETTIQPVPREQMITVGGRILATLAPK